MKSFKEFRENVTPKMYDTIPQTVQDVHTNRVRTLDVIKKSNERFRKSTKFNLPLPLAKKSTSKVTT